MSLLCWGVQVGFEEDALDHNARYQRLEQWARERYPMLQEVIYRWSGQVIEPIDALAFIGTALFVADTVLVGCSSVAACGLFLAQ